MLPIFVINLDRSQDRLSAMRCQLDKLGLSFQRIKAVEGLDIPEDLAAYFAHHNRRGDPIIEAGAVGCYASHLRAYQQIVLSGVPYALVLEDDAVLPESLCALVQAVVRELPACWDFVQLAKPPRHAVQRLAALPRASLVRYSRIPSGTVGYLISRAGAKKMLNPAIERVWAIDTDTRRPWLFGLDAYGVVPNPISHGGFPSTLRSAAKRWRRGMPRPTPYTWTNMPLHSPRGVIWNMRKLGILGWLRCAVSNGAIRIVRAAALQSRAAEGVK